MKKLLLILSAALMFAFVGCESLGGDDVVGGSYNVRGAIQKGPFVQGSNITIQPLNKNLKPIGQMYTTQTTNDAGMFEMDGVNSKYAEIIATGYYYDEVEGKISASPLTLRAIADLKDGAQTNVNLLTSLTYNRIKNLVTNDGRGISEAQEQAEKELYTVLGIPTELQPNVSCGAMNIAQNGEGDGLLLALSAILQEGRSVGELTEYISKFATDLADDGRVEQTLLDKFNLDRGHLYDFINKVKSNLNIRYQSLGLECTIPDFDKYLPYFDASNNYFVMYFTYDEEYDFDKHFLQNTLIFESDAELIGYMCKDGSGEIYLSKCPKSIWKYQLASILTITIPEGVTEIGSWAFADNNNSLVSITLPEGLTTIGDAAFHCCWRLANINLPESLTTIGYAAFASTSLESVDIPDGVTAIQDNTFIACYDLKDVSLPENLVSIGTYAFCHCHSLSSITIPESVTTFGRGCFTDCIGLQNFNGKCVSEDNRCVIVDDALYAFAGCGVLDYSVPQGVTAIEPEVFYGCTCDSITLPEGVVSIGEGAFFNCICITSMSIPESVTEIERYAFANCPMLTEIYCKPCTPPTAKADESGLWGILDMFDGSAPDRKIYVPTESVDAYKAAEYWSEYADAIVGYEFE